MSLDKILNFRFLQKMASAISVCEWVNMICSVFAPWEVWRLERRYIDTVNLPFLCLRSVVPGLHMKQWLLIICFFCRSCRQFLVSYIISSHIIYFFSQKWNACLLYGKGWLIVENIRTMNQTKANPVLFWGLYWTVKSLVIFLKGPDSFCFHSLLTLFRVYVMLSVLCWSSCCLHSPLCYSKDMNDSVWWMKTRTNQTKTLTWALYKREAFA